MTLDNSVRVEYDLIGGLLIHIPRQPNLENFTDRTLSTERKEVESMAARLKARVDEHWVTAYTPQQLANKVIAAKSSNLTGITVKKYCDDHMKTHCDGLQPNTARGYWDYLKNHIYPFMGKMDIGQVTRDDVQRYINTKANTLAKKTIQEHITIMGYMFDLAVEDALIPKNPFKSRHLKMHGLPSKKRKPYDSDTFNAMERDVLPNLQEEEKLFAAISMYTGMRRGEVLALQWRDINLTGKSITVNKATSFAGKNRADIKGTKTENGIRELPISPELMSILKQYHKADGYVVRAKRHPLGDEPLTNQACRRMTERINKAIVDAGYSFKFGSHKMRHTVFTDMAGANVDLPTMARIAGHSDPGFTAKQYINPREREMRGALEKMGTYRHDGA